eukprot:2904857-Pyramimonas_sp.AAC.1
MCIRDSLLVSAAAAVASVADWLLEISIVAVLFGADRLSHFSRGQGAALSALECGANFDCLRGR